MHDDIFASDVYDLCAERPAFEGYGLWHRRVPSGLEVAANLKVAALNQAAPVMDGPWHDV